MSLEQYIKNFKEDNKIDLENLINLKTAIRHYITERGDSPFWRELMKMNSLAFGEKGDDKLYAALVEREKALESKLRGKFKEGLLDSLFDYLIYYDLCDKTT